MMASSGVSNETRPWTGSRRIMGGALYQHCRRSFRPRLQAAKIPKELRRAGSRVPRRVWLFGSGGQAPWRPMNGEDCRPIQTVARAGGSEGRFGMGSARDQSQDTRGGLAERVVAITALAAITHRA